ncbi:macro domain-containing protein [Diplodia corticola]|uniref:Macro domain-containing protein n=1 Tax=Diplodia corticola TaxID=236234 RepID=A0A1J9S1P2_9PEZI|nr:macro domain-containing protein [Diplodia corticola]OJD38859.1 macro domain-containing protein [Diplodia corticola]
MAAARSNGLCGSGHGGQGSRLESLHRNALRRRDWTGPEVEAAMSKGWNWRWCSATKETGGGEILHACPLRKWGSVDRATQQLQPSATLTLTNSSTFRHAPVVLGIRPGAMVSIRAHTIACSRSFRLLAAALESGPSEHRSLIDPTSLEDEYGRFRVWSGNLGAQQKGHSSLDYRLRDSPLLHSNVLKLLHELEINCNEARAVVSGARLPYEQQAAGADFSDDSASEDSDDESRGSEEDRPRFELQQRMFEIVDIINSLYRLSIRIRNPTIRIRSLKAATYRQVDPDTGVDVLSQYAEYDRKYVADSLTQLRAGFPQRKDEDVAFLVDRLSKAITKRRQQFKYWKKHRDKLANSSPTNEDVAPIDEDRAPNPQLGTNGVESSLHAPSAIKFDLRAPPSEAHPRTLLSGTEATAHHRTLDDAVDSQSVTSVATTARDLGGHGIDLPPPPSSADGERDFECPYCYVICPARYSKTRSWKTHILQDLQPYVCTYKHCSSEDQMFRSRREWLDHEASAHRKVWRCPGHSHAVYSSQAGIRSHLDDAHGGDLSEMQIRQLIGVAEASTCDSRDYCPICFAGADDLGVAGNLHNHIANHLERFASFALPRITQMEDDKSAASMDAYHGRGSSSDETEAASSHWSADTASGYEAGQPSPDYQRYNLETTANDVGDHRIDPGQDAGRSELSASAVQSVPDATKDNLAAFVEASRALTPQYLTAQGEKDVIKDKSEKSFEIHSIDTSIGDDKTETSRINTGEPKEQHKIRISNLPTGDEANRRLFAFFETLGCQRFTLDPHVEDRGYVTFDSQRNAEEALLSFDETRFPNVELELEHGDENEMSEPTSTPGGAGAAFDVQGFLETLSRVLREPQHSKTIVWAKDGKTFQILDEEAFSQDILPSFGFEEFPSFKDSLVACGFRQQYRVDTSGLKQSSTWFHEHFQRDSPEVARSAQFFTRLRDHVFGRAKLRGSLTTQNINNNTTEMDDDLRGSSKNAYPLKAASDIPSISQLYVNSELFVPDWLQNSSRASADASLPVPKDEVNRKISMILHDITKLDVDAIVNATSRGLNVGASDSIGFRVHQAAGPGLLQECRALGGCTMSQAVMTNAYNLPCRKVIHTVRPHYFEAVQSVGGEDLLASCYWNCLKLAVDSGLKSIAFPCLSAGGFGFPNREAAEIALRTTRAFLDAGEGDSLQKIIFCVYKKTDKLVYRYMIPRFFPPTRTWLGQPNEREVRVESPGSLLNESPVQEQAGVSDTGTETAESRKPKRPIVSRLSSSTESLGRLIGGPALWACCKCRARPMETPKCLICYHEPCNTCEEENANGRKPNLFLVDLHPSPSLLEEPQNSDLSPFDDRELINFEKQARASVRSRPNSPTQNYIPTYVKTHRKHLSLDTLFYYDLPFQFDSADLDFIIITRELNKEQTELLFEHSRRHRGNLPSLIRTRTHPDPLDAQKTIRIGSDPSYNNQRQPAAGSSGARPIFLPGPFVAAHHCAFSIDPRTRRWVVSVTEAGRRATLNGRWIFPFEVPKINGKKAQESDDLPEHNDDGGFFVRSGDILGIGDDDDDPRPVHIFRVELDGLGDTAADGGGEDAMWEEAEARASRYGFPTIGLVDEDDNDNNSEPGDDDDDDDDTDVDLDISTGYRIVDAATQTPDDQAAGRGIISARWTRLDRRLVNPAALNEAGLPFENRVRYLLVFRELAPGEVQRLAARTREERAMKAATEFTRKERRRKERRVREQKKAARERKKGAQGSL